jgi:hypothetical protein
MHWMLENILLNFLLIGSQSKVVQILISKLTVLYITDFENYIEMRSKNEKIMKIRLK